MKDAIIFTAGMTAIFLGVILEELHAQTSRLTSDPTRAIHGLQIPGIFVPPSDGIIVEFRTNLIPIVVLQEVTSNVIQRTVWMLNGRLQTAPAVKYRFWTRSNLLTSFLSGGGGDVVSLLLGDFAILQFFQGGDFTGQGSAVF